MVLAEQKTNPIMKEIHVSSAMPLKFYLAFEGARWQYINVE